MIHKLCSERSIQARGVIGLFPAYRDGDDVKMMNEGKSDVIATLCGLRQQVCRYILSRTFSLINILLQENGVWRAGGGKACSVCYIPGCHLYSLTTF